MAARNFLIHSKKLIKNKNINVKQKFNYLLVVDFEATCEQFVPIEKPEIIEFPCIVYNTKQQKIENVFHKYVKPKLNPILTPYCTELTGIMQETVDDEKHFEDVYHEFSQWINHNGYVDQSAFVTCGDWDLKVMLPKQLNYDGLSLSNYFKQWINLKTSFCLATNYYPRSLADMLITLKLEPLGRPHSGIHDTSNMIRIIETLINKYNFTFDYTSSIPNDDR